MSALLDPFSFAFFRQALATAVLVGALCGLLGLFIVFRGMSFIGHGLSHAAFGGAAVSHLLRIDVQIGAGVGGLLSALLIQAMSASRLLRPDTAINLVTTALFALGVALISASGRFTKSLEATLFGNILGSGQNDLLGIGAVLLLTLLVLLRYYRPLIFVLYDPESAAAFGLPVRRLDLLLTCLVALTVVVSMNAVGVTLIAAALVAPAAAARLLTDRIERAFLIAPALGALSGLLGLEASYFLDIASGAAIVLVNIALFGGAWILSLLRRRRAHAHAHRHGSLIHSHPHTHAHTHDHPHRPAPADEPPDCLPPRNHGP